MIRVQFGPMPAMLRTIMGDLLAGEADIEIVGTVADRADCLHAARASGAEIVVVQDEVHQGSSCLDLMLAGPNFGLFGVSTDGRSATGISVARQSIRLDAGRPSSLAQAIRTMASKLRTAAPAAVTAPTGLAACRSEETANSAIDLDGRRPSGDT